MNNTNTLIHALSSAAATTYLEPLCLTAKDGRKVAVWFDHRTGMCYPRPETD